MSDPIIPVDFNVFKFVIDAVNMIFWITVAFVILLVVYKIAEYWFLKWKKIDFLSLNYNRLKSAAEKNIIPACLNQRLFLFGGGNEFGVIKGTAQIFTSTTVPCSKGDKGAKQKIKQVGKKNVTTYEKHEIVSNLVFFVDKQRNALMRFLSTFIFLFRKHDLIIVPFESVIYDRYNPEDQSFERTHLKNYNDLRGNVFLNVSSLIPHVDNILRPNTFDIDIKHVKAFEDQIYRWRYEVAINEGADQVRRASYSNPAFVKNMESQSVDRQALANQKESQGV